MNTSTTPRLRPRADRWALWIALAAGLALMAFAAIARADGGAQAKRTEHFEASLAAGSTLRIENVWGDIVASPGREASVVVTIIAKAPTQARADEIASATVIDESKHEREYELRTVWPRDRHRRSELGCKDCRITARYDVKIPPGVRVVFHNVSGDVRVNDTDGDLDLQTVNGSVVVMGARRSVSAQSVNGSVDAVFQSLPSSARTDLKTVNGAVHVTFPKDSHFDLSASSMNGTIASTFPLPSRMETEPEVLAAPRAPVAPGHSRPPVIEKEKDEEDSDGLDLHELEKEVQESMRDAEAEMREAGREMREAHREMGRMSVMLPGSEYRGSIGQAGASVRLSTLNGPITVLASGTKEADARVLASPRRSFTVVVPRVRVSVPPVPVVAPVPPMPEIPPAPRVAPAPRPIISVAPMLAEGEDVVRGDIGGDFLATVRGGSYRLGNVGGRVRIVTQAGEIHVGSARGGAELKTSGGDVTIGSVGGDLRATTLAGDVHVGAISGASLIETSGGDILIERAGGFADLKTDGGDIVVHAAQAGLRARTGGGSVRIVVVSREPRGGITVHDDGGDVTLTLPSDARAEVELEEASTDENGEMLIRSDFPEIAVSRRADSARATGTLNGGGPRVTIRTSSGTIRLRKGPPAGS